MKKINLSILLLLLAIPVFSQQVKTVSKQSTPKPTVYKLQNVKSILDISSFDKTLWSLYGKYNKAEYAPIESKKVISVIDTFLSNGPEERVDQFNLIKKYRKNIDTVFQGLGLLGSGQLGDFFCSKDQVPVHFGMMGDTALSFIVTGVFIDKVYNTLRLTSRQMAAKVITSYLLPSLEDFAKAFPGKEIKYFGISATYGSKDFSNEYSTEAEYVSIIAPAKLVKKYVSGNLTEDELVNSLDIYVSDRDMNVGIKKIKISLE